MPVSGPKGRGARWGHDSNQFQQNRLEVDQWYLQELEDEGANRTQLIPEFPKSAIRPVNSPDVPANFSINPYQGCEHGCAYCYARPTHEYWGFGPGLDFEKKVIYKKGLIPILNQELNRKSWCGQAIMMSGNTDCYQPAERKLKLTRAILGLLAEYRNPVSLITKNALIVRDLDHLQCLNEFNAVHVNISFTSLDETLRRHLEPRTSSVQQKMKAIDVLRSAGIPVNVLVGPVIPGLNSEELPALVKMAADLGANSVGYILVRLSPVVRPIFEQWLAANHPDRAQKVMSLIKSCHGGGTMLPEFGERMSGAGPYAAMVQNQFRLEKARYKFSGMPELSRKHFRKLNKQQYPLFE